MSADNGIYICEFPSDSGPEYRVVEAGAFENIYDGTIEEQDAARVVMFSELVKVL